LKQSRAPVANWPAHRSTPQGYTPDPADQLPAEACL
jgi:hypothetical protein